MNITCYKLLLLYASHVSLHVLWHVNTNDMGVLSSIFDIWNKDLRHINKRDFGGVVLSY